MRSIKVHDEEGPETHYYIIPDIKTHSDKSCRIIGAGCASPTFLTILHMHSQTHFLEKVAHGQLLSCLIFRFAIFRELFLALFFFFFGEKRGVIIVVRRCLAVRATKD